MIIVILIVLSIILIILFICLFSGVIGLIMTRGVPFVSLTKRQLMAVNKCVKLNSTDRVMDLGCGDGRVLRMFEKQGVKDLTGYEINFWAYLSAKFKNKISKSKAKIYFRNFKKNNLSEYNVIFCYLMPNYLNSLKNKFDQELKPGTKIISYAFQIKNWREPKIIYTNNKNNNLGRIFIYTL
jgi:SAM-dependent methyltransferase